MGFNSGFKGLKIELDYMRLVLKAGNS